MKKRHSEEQIIRILREAEAREVPIRDLCRQHNITEQTFYRWRNVYGGMDVAEARRLKELESENARLKRLVAEQMLVIDGLREFGRKMYGPPPVCKDRGSRRRAVCTNVSGLLQVGRFWRPGHDEIRAQRS